MKWGEEWYCKQESQRSLVTKDIKVKARIQVNSALQVRLKPYQRIAINDLAIKVIAAS